VKYYWNEACPAWDARFLECQVMGACQDNCVSNGGHSNRTGAMKKDLQKSDENLLKFRIFSRKSIEVGQ
jgi:hypothetical protein